jgi:hypothetical protein
MNTDFSFKNETYKKPKPFKYTKQLENCCYLLLNYFIEINNQLNRGYNKKDEIAREIVIGFLNDFIAFTQTSIESIRSNPPKLTVAYALARKPYEDAIHYFERLILDEEKFVEAFLSDSSKIGSKKYYEAINKKEIHEKAKLKINYDLDLENFRFSKEIKGLFHKSLHHFTENPNWKTESENINFVFLNQDPKLVEYHTYKLYKIHLANLFYGYGLISKLVEKYNIEISDLYKIRLVLAFTWGNSIFLAEKITFDDIEYKCSECGNISYHFKTKKGVRNFLFDGLTQCEHCGLVEKMGKKMCCYLKETEVLIQYNISDKQKFNLIFNFMKKYGMVLEDSKYPKKLNGYDLFYSLKPK